MPPSYFLWFILIIFFLRTWFMLFYKAGDAIRCHYCAFCFSYDLYFS
jgi:hypothetical protein